MIEVEKQYNIMIKFSFNKLSLQFKKKVKYHDVKFFNAYPT
jgi:hypothetical protein